MNRAALLLAVVAAAQLSACTSTVPGVAVPQTADRGSRKVFDESALERGVEHVLTGPYGIPAEDVERVDCPADQEVKVGNKFSCAVRIAGQEKVVDITVRSGGSANEYEVGTPRDK